MNYCLLSEAWGNNKIIDNYNDYMNNNGYIHENQKKDKEENLVVSLQIEEEAQINLCKAILTSFSTFCRWTFSISLKFPYSKSDRTQ